MEYASKDLIQEHDAIIFSLKILDEMCSRIESGKDVSIDDVTDIIGFLILFADKCHHGKEEGILFPALQEAGIQNQNGPIGMMLIEHEQGRNFIRQMNDAVSVNLFDKKEFTHAARGYAALLRSHIMKENNILFPMGDLKLSPSKQKEIINAFEEFEEKVIGKGKHEELHAMLQEFKNKYLK